MALMFTLQHEFELSMLPSIVLIYVFNVLIVKKYLEKKSPKSTTFDL